MVLAAALGVIVIAQPSSIMQPSTTTLTSTTTVTVTTTGESPQTFVSLISPEGLQLELTLNATTVHFGGGISGQVTIVNTSNRNITVSYLGLSENLSVWSGYITECPLGYFAGYAIFAGHFAAGNISSAGTPLSMVPGDTGIIDVLRNSP
ncbi:MAG: hypothetical protein ACRD6W_17075, partial [Nitrososphaerales archaeon]